MIRLTYLEDIKLLVGGYRCVNVVTYGRFCKLKSNISTPLDVGKREDYRQCVNLVELVVLLSKDMTNIFLAIVTV
jgi:hypothetical protein